MLQYQSVLPFTVMGLYINLLAIDYPKVPSDKCRFTLNILAIYTKALVYTANELEFYVKHSD